MAGKLFKVSLFSLLAYLLQATAAIHFSIWDVAPNIALALVAIISVSLGRKYTFLMSLAIGYLLEIMLPMLNYLNLVLYPVCAMLAALAFSDKSERKMEEERSTGRRSRVLPAHLRIPLCSALSVLVFESVHLFYIYLNGVALNSDHILRAFISIAYSAVISGVLQFPARWWLGVYKLAKVR